MLRGMPKRPPSKDAREFGARLVALLASKNVPRRGAGVYLQGRYKVSTVTANDWLNGAFKPGTATARRIAVDHGSNFDWLYFGTGQMGGNLYGSEGTPAHSGEPLPPSQSAGLNLNRLRDARKVLTFLDDFLDSPAGLWADEVAVKAVYDYLSALDGEPVNDANVVQVARQVVHDLRKELTHDPDRPPPD